MSQKHPWKLYLATVARALLFPLFFVVVTIIVVINHLALEIASETSEDVLNIAEQYTALDPYTIKDNPEKVESFREYLIHSPSGDDALGWMLLESLTTILNDGPGEETEQLTRQALHRLQGVELYTFIRSLRERVKGFRNPNHTDLLAENSDLSLSDAIKKSILRDRDVYTFTEKELSALQACSDTFKDLEDSLLPLVGKYQWMIYSVMPELMGSKCSLTGKISLK